MLDANLMEVVLRRGVGVTPLVTRFRELEARRKALQGRLDDLRAQRNGANQEMARLDKKSPDFASARDRLRDLSQAIKDGETELTQVEEDSRQTLLVIPNAPHTSVPDGEGEAGNRVEEVWGKKPSFSFTPKPHWEVGENLGILDFERAAKISGARFTVLKKMGARLSRALINFMLELHSGRGYTEMWPPALVRRPALEGTGQLPKFEEDVFKTAGEQEFFLSPTAEVQLTNFHGDEILEADQLPIRYVAYAPCFRAEAGSHGRDTRGLIRQHQFDKVELVKITTPEQSYAELEGLRRDAEEVLRALNLHYRVITLCTGDIGFSAAKTYDLEVWLPGMDAFREISSCSNCESFQARRAKIRYRPGTGQKPVPVHTLNGSGLAVGRTLVAILEQYQRADGSVEIPPVLRPFLGGQSEIR